MTAAKQKSIAYFRVSTKKQGESGLRLDGQIATVAAYVRKLDRGLLAEYTEVETGLFLCSKVTAVMSA